VQLQGTLFRASQFLSEELPIRLAHRVQELGDLPDGLNDMPSIKKVQTWYSQSFEVRTSKSSTRRPNLTGSLPGHYKSAPAKPRVGSAGKAATANETGRTRIQDTKSDYT